MAREAAREAAREVAREAAHAAAREVAREAACRVLMLWDARSRADLGVALRSWAANASVAGRQIGELPFAPQAER